MEGYLQSCIKQFRYYKMLGEKTFAQLGDDALFFRSNEECNSIAMIVAHLSGNMLSRWTEFLTSDGEKEWRNRDMEFSGGITTRAAMMDAWNAGWNCLFATLDQLTDSDMSRIIHIRNEGHTVFEAINRQLAHYPYHIGQIVHIGKTARGTDWSSLSIPRNGSAAFNTAKFSQAPHRAHFTDGALDTATDSSSVPPGQ